MKDSFDDIDNTEGFGNTEYIDNTDAVPPPPTSFPHLNPLPTLHSKTTVSVLIQTSLLPASRGY